MTLMSFLPLVADVAVAVDLDVRCPADMAPVGKTLVRGLDDTVPILPGGGPAWCGSDESLFLAAAEAWNDDPRLRATQAFRVCSRPDGSMVWSRVGYIRRWPTSLLALEGETRRGVRARPGRPRALYAESGPFSPTSLEDLASVIERMGFWQLPPTVSNDDPAGVLSDVLLVGARLEGREHQVVGGDYCDLKTQGLSVIAYLLIERSRDPIAYLARAGAVP